MHRETGVILKAYYTYWIEFPKLSESGFNYWKLKV